MGTRTLEKPRAHWWVAGLPSYRTLWQQWRDRRLQKKILRLGRWYEPLHGDELLKSLVDEIMQKCGITAFVETGTFVGDTTRYIALRYPKVRVLTCEINGRWFKLAKHFCEGIGNIEFFLGESPKFLESLREFLNGERPIFWLDAHWGDYWPLVDETKIVAFLPRYVIIVDDFEVPGKPRFHYDTYNGVKNCLSLHGKVLGERCYVPNYDPDPSCLNPAGYGVFFKGIEFSKLNSIATMKELYG